MDIAIKKAKEAGIGWVTAKGMLIEAGYSLQYSLKSTSRLMFHVNFIFTVVYLFYLIVYIPLTCFNL